VADIYDSADTIIAGYIMVVLKTGIFFIFLSFYSFLMLPFKTDTTATVFSFFIFCSFVFSLLAIRQKYIKQILAFTSVNQTSYLLLGMLGGTNDCINNTIVYMLIYAATLLLFFMCLGIFSHYPQSK